MAIEIGEQLAHSATMQAGRTGFRIGMKLTGLTLGLLLGVLMGSGRILAMASTEAGRFALRRGGISVKELHKVARGNITDIPLTPEQRDEVRRVLRKMGVDFSMTKLPDGTWDLQIAGTDIERARLALDQATKVLEANNPILASEHKLQQALADPQTQTLPSTTPPVSGKPEFKQVFDAANKRHLVLVNPDGSQVELPERADVLTSERVHFDLTGQAAPAQAVTAAFAQAGYPVDADTVSQHLSIDTNAASWTTPEGSAVTYEHSVGGDGAMTLTADPDAALTSSTPSQIRLDSSGNVEQLTYHHTDPTQATTFVFHPDGSLKGLDMPQGPQSPRLSVACPPSGLTREAPQQRHDSLTHSEAPQPANTAPVVEPTQGEPAQRREVTTEAETPQHNRETTIPATPGRSTAASTNTQSPQRSRPQLRAKKIKTPANVRAELVAAKNEKLAEARNQPKVSRSRSKGAR